MLYAYSIDHNMILYLYSSYFSFPLQGKTKMDPYALAANDVISASQARAAEDGELNRLLLSSENNDIDPAAAAV